MEQKMEQNLKALEELKTAWKDNNDLLKLTFDVFADIINVLIAKEQAENPETPV